MHKTEGLAKWPIIYSRRIKILSCHTEIICWKIDQFLIEVISNNMDKLEHTDNMAQLLQHIQLQCLIYD